MFFISRGLPILIIIELILKILFGILTNNSIDEMDFRLF